MLPSSPAKILVGISLDPEENNEILSWAIRVLAHPNDNIVALHVLVSEESKKKKRESTRKKQSKIRQAKAHVISVLAEFAGTCCSKQINLEAKVGFSNSVGRGLIEEAKSISADHLLLLRGQRDRSNRTSFEVIRYCLEHTPLHCSVISVGKSEQPKQNSNPADAKETHRSNSRIHSSRSASPVEKHVFSETKRKNTSPRTVLDEIEGESQSTEEETCSFGDSTITYTESPPLAPKINKQISPYKLVYSFLKSPLRKINRSLSKKDKHQPFLKCFSYDEISNATNNFEPENMVGKGGYSEVFRGDISGGRTIAVKRLSKDNDNANKDKEFLLELGIIGHVCHPNTAKLVGYCIENGLYLVFNFSQNGNLASALHGKSSKLLEWPVRYKIALGIARGLHYLHKRCKRRIIHRDIKASNVLLGPDYEPQITDFGLAKWLPNKWTHHAVIPIEGTFGYLAPEYFMHGIVDEKIDVFSFGILLLEIITGRRPVDSSQQNLLLWAKPHMESGNVTELADPKLEGEYDADELRRLVFTASHCVRQTSVWRPSMSEVLDLLTSNGNDSDDMSIPKFISDEMDDYSMVFGYDVPTDISLEDFL
ncbi:receptor-like serine/threonine-protein kinase [Tripterygium wilfordii]|uniref:Receptor-like serine/threonine-protein kinase n=1 Tax=Tripterygium wilfordii TaxID=458696 RepID=A0A7J7DST4_TRIWF|nr:probable receptor-like serine/threonine-protein kinase At5g57670 [Tripterygium wilfordii]KAF5749452.1 receptor-like serine/threonine-protein kinase [Tripterygium wilfordii]